MAEEEVKSLNSPLIDTNIRLINTKKFLLVFISFLLVFFSGLRAEAAFLHFSPSSGHYAQNQNFNVSILINADQSTNAVRGVVLFPLEYLSVISVNYPDSVVDLWVRKPSFSNSGINGNVTFEGVILNPGFIGSEGKVVEIVFRVKKQGSASVKMTDFALLANDGLGTNIATVGGDANFTITAPLAKGQEPTEKTLDTIAERIKRIEEQTRLSVFAQEVNFYQRAGNLWKILPLWLKFIAIIFIAITAIILLLLAGLLVILIIWLYSYLNYKHWHLKLHLKRFIEYIKIWVKKSKLFLGMAETELEEDLSYSYGQLKETYNKAFGHLSLKILLKNYFGLPRRIIRRFLTKNVDKD